MSKTETPESLTRELRRKTFHLGGLIYLGVYMALGYPKVLRVMAGWMVVVAGLESARLLSPAARKVIQRIFGPIIRDKEHDRFSGAFYTTLGVFVVFLAFGDRPTIVSASILYLSLGDAASAVVGKMWGRHQYRVLGDIRSLEGTGAGIAVALLCGLLLRLPAAAVLLGAGAFTLTDTVGLPPDDNLWIPVVTGGALYLLGVR